MESRVKTNLERKKLGDVCNFVRGPFGGSLKKDIFKKEGYAVYEQQHAIYNQFEDIRYYIDEDKFNEMKRFELNTDDLIMSCSGTMGKIAIVPKNIKRGIINQALLKLTPSNKLSGNYLKLWMQSNIFQESLKEHSQGATIQNVASVAILKKIEINLPLLPEQIRIVEILNQAEALITQRKQSVSLFDELLKSTFLEMFGDPVRNDKKWKLDFLENYSTKISSGSTPLGGKEVYQRTGKYFIRSQNVRMNFLDYSDVYCISDEIHNKMKRTWIKNEDVLLNITGASIGRVATYYGEDDNANVNQHVCIIRTIKDKLNPRFLEFLISSDHFQKVSIASSTGGTRESFTFEMIKKFKIILPPINHQIKFTTIVEKIEILKSQCEASLDELQNMYGVLSQKAFKGELNIKELEKTNN